MGLILDSTELIYAERRGMTAQELLACYRFETNVCLAVLTLAELQHGVRRASTPELRDRRVAFLLAARQTFTTVPITDEVALLAGTLDADLQSMGERIALIDLLIAATALSRQAKLSTRNLRHFQRVPGLQVISPDLHPGTPAFP